MTKQLGWVVVLAASGALGCDCGGGGGPDAGTDAATDSGPEPARIYYEPTLPAASDNPFPGDFMTVADPTTPTGLRVSVPPARGFPYVDQLNTLDGFTVTYGFYVRVTRALDPASLVPGTVELYAYDPAGAGPVAAIPGELTYDASAEGIQFLPDVPLASRSRFVVVVRPGLLDSDGRPVQASVGWEAAVAANEPEAAEILSFLGDRAGIAAADVLHAHTYTTQTVAEDLIAVREGLVAALGPPAVTIDEAYPPRDMNGDIHPGILARLPPLPPDLPVDTLETDDIGVIAWGTIVTAEYRDAFGHWARDPSTGAPVQMGTLDLDFMLTLPANTAGPVPVVVFSHALGVCKETLIAMADTLGEWGIGAIGIDAVGHGTRVPGGGNCGESLSITDFINIVDLLNTRDVFRQTVSDQLHLVRVLRDPAGGGVDILPFTGDLATSGDGVPDFETNGPTALVGQSLGSFIGTITSAVEPDLGAAVLNVGGLSFLAVVASTGFSFSIDTAFAALTLLEAGDNWAYARAFVEPFAGLTGAVPTSVLLQMAVNDDTVENEGSWRFANVVGSPLVLPAPAGIVEMGTGTSSTPVMAAAPPTLGLYAFDNVEHEFLLLPGVDAADTTAAQEQAAAFLYTAIAGGYPSPVIVDPYDATMLGMFHP